MKVAFIVRSTLFTVAGGDTIQIKETAKYLQKLGVHVDILLSTDKPHYPDYDLFHFFNITRPGDILRHIHKIKCPSVLTPILVDYSEFDRQHRKGVTGIILRLFSADANEYIKSFARALKGADSFPGGSYWRKGHRQSVKKILKAVAIVMPNSKMEYENLENRYGIKKEHVIVYNGIDRELFQPGEEQIHNTRTVLCVARIEGIKNQLNLIRVLNNSEYELILIGAAAPNQKKYFQHCKKIAASNVRFIEYLPQAELLRYYRRAKTHVLPSWFETCGLSSMEAAAMGCNIVITDKGYTKEYFGEDAFYCEPGDSSSILEQIQKASSAPVNNSLQKKILQKFTWQEAAATTLEAYRKVLQHR